MPSFVYRSLPSAVMYTEHAVSECRLKCLKHRSGCRYTVLKVSRLSFFSESVNFSKCDGACNDGAAFL
eukprot:scaffold140741_cov62-Attheya_sp.AAC.4